MFVNRQEELARLGEWWSTRGAGLSLVWGRRRVGKTALVQEFSKERRAVFHTAAGRPLPDELAALSRTAAPFVDSAVRDLGRRPFTDWDDALESLGGAATSEPLLLVLDEFPELVSVSPELPGVIRAFWDHAERRRKLRVLLCGSAVRTMEALQDQRAPLFGRADLSLLVHPFRPHEAARMLPALAPADRALVWGICGGTPLYLSWWQQDRSVRENLDVLVCRPGGRLMTEGDFILATEGERGALAGRALRAIAAGRTKHNEIEAALRADPARTLDRLVNLRLIERLVPVTEEARRTRLRTYRIADNFLAFWLGVVDRYRSEIERGLGATIIDSISGSLDDHMGPRWEEAFREHLRALAQRGELQPDVVAVGPFWTGAGSVEIDAVVLAGRAREAVLVGEAKWARQVDGSPIARELAAKARSLSRVREPLRYAVAARESVRPAEDVLPVTAAEVFAG